MASSLDIIIQAQDKASGVFQKIGSEGEGMGGKLKMLIPVLAGVVAGFASLQTLKSAVDTTSELGEAVRKLSMETGLSAPAASDFLFAVKSTGANADDASKSLGILSKNLEAMNVATEHHKAPAAAMANAMQFLNLKTTDLLDGMGKLTTQGLDKLADRFAKMPDSAEKTALAMALFGKSGKDMIPILDLGSKGLEEATLMAQKLGVELSGAQVDKIHKYVLAHREMDEAMEGVRLQIGLALMPVLTKLADWFVKEQPAIREFVDKAIVYVTAKFEEWKPKIEELGDNLIAFGGHVLEVAKTVAEVLVPDFTHGFDSIMNGALIPAFNWLTNHKAAMIAVIAAIGAAVALSLGPVSLAALAIVGFITAFGYVEKALPNLESSVDKTFHAIQMAVYNYLDQVTARINKFIDDYNKIGGWLTGNIGKISALNQGLGAGENFAPDVPASNPAYGGGRASGGLVMPGTAYTVGEHGPETLIMGNQGGNVTSGSAPTTIVLQIPGMKDFVFKVVRDGLNGGAFRGVLT